MESTSIILRYYVAVYPPPFFKYTLSRFIKLKNAFKLLIIKLKKQIMIYREVLNTYIIQWIV
ncbi:hypothetical protein FPV238 [Fowlpox virus]|uniref:Uncharacterized protein FPV238 n=2 Tax=Fowlpox virus TaxID=10261 RepID=V238_FOWPN|nr:hypothetical protein FPV238 [Fowlpox virus]Q9YPJ6.1 RecName: Full=Uncharacterized protein FPV238; AltName: Full=ORF f [Fowlpox virus strain NVSL]UNS14484.1 ALPV-320 [Albatrosspox virus]WPD90984.1 hypothetical protein PPV_Vac110-fpv238 [Avipoxvirus sp.]CAE52774.1 putative C-type lectin [Fowlpox virus isolate HP-438/Munich]AAF44582.1 ORF FPV238 hypothetical protein [Fowlpox virus]ART91672.1 hypothetical protein [Fowlpox virus]